MKQAEIEFNLDEDTAIAVARLLGIEEVFEWGIEITHQQAIALAKMPLGICNDELIEEIYEALIESGYETFIPQANRDLILDDDD